MRHHSRQRALKSKQCSTFHALQFICADFMLKQSTCLCVLFTYGMQSVGKQKCFCNPKSWLNPTPSWNMCSPQPQAAWVLLWLQPPQGCHAAGRRALGRRAQSAAGWAPPQASQLPSRAGRALCRRCCASLPPLASVHSTWNCSFTPQLLSHSKLQLPCSWSWVKKLPLWVLSAIKWRLKQRK